MASPPTPDLDKQFHHLLSLNTPTSPPSSSPRPELHQRSFRKIGAIYAHDGGTAVAIKLAKSPDQTELWNDYRQHISIFRAFRRHLVSGEVRVPEV